MPKLSLIQSNPSAFSLQPSALLRCSTILLSACFLAGCASVQTSTKKIADTTTTAPPSTNVHTVARPAGKTKPQLEAVFESLEMAPVKVEPKVWTDLPVLEAVPHGARVKKGDVLVKFDLEKLKESIDEQEQDRPAAALALELAGLELENLEQTTTPRLEAARRAHRIADEDLAYFEKVGRATREKGVQFGLKGAEQRLEGAQEELKQLSKMYKADDLTEDTEEIILKRSKYAVEAAEHSLEVSKQSSAWSLKTAIPREADTLRLAKRDQDIALANAEQTLPRTLTKKRYDYEKAKREAKKADKKFADLKKDLQVLEVRAPISGMVYYGACEAGKWTTGAAVAKKLLPTGKLAANEVFMTIVNPDKMFLRSLVQEADLSHFSVGLQGKASLVSAPDKKLPVKLDELGAIPLPTGGFEAKLSFEKDPKVKIFPGMNCKVSLGDAGKASPLQVPKEAVFTEDGDSIVYLQKADAKPEKRQVKTGDSDGKMIEILQGLAEGDKILLTRPE